MPELPEVETMRRGILPVVGSRILSVEQPACRLKPILLEPEIEHFSSRVCGKTITQVIRIGKRVGVVLNSGDTVILEPRMTGLVLISAPPNQEHLRLRFKLDQSETPELLFWDRRGLGQVRVVDAAEFARRYGPESLGPDALAVESWQQLRNQFCKSRRPIKVALLDQKLLAGVGNLYASEILHLAQIAPTQLCTELQSVDWKRIYSGLHTILNEAILYEGSTLSDGTYRNALNQNGTYQNQHAVYDREHLPCLGCRKSKIVRIVQAQRSTFYCPECQPHRPI